MTRKTNTYHRTNRDTCTTRLRTRTEGSSQTHTYTSDKDVKPRQQTTMSHEHINIHIGKQKHITNDQRHKRTKTTTRMAYKTLKNPSKPHRHIEQKQKYIKPTRKQKLQMYKHVRNKLITNRQTQTHKHTGYTPHQQQCTSTNTKSKHSALVQLDVYHSASLTTLTRSRPGFSLTRQ